FGGIELHKVRPAHVQAVLDAETARGCSARTVGQARAALSSAFTFAVRGGFIAINPVRATQTPTPQKPRLTTPTPENLPALIDAADKTPRDKDRSERRTWAVPILLAATTGARRAEVLGLRWSHVDLDRGRVRIDDTVQRVNGKLVFVPPKTERARR